VIGGPVQTFYLLQYGFDGADVAVIGYISKRHVGGVESLVRGGRGDLQRVAFTEVWSLMGVRVTCGEHSISRDRLSRGTLFYCKGNCWRWSGITQTAGDPKISLLDINKLYKSIPAGDPKRKG